MTWDRQWNVFSQRIHDVVVRDVSAFLTWYRTVTVAHAGILRHRAWVQEIGGSMVYLLGVRLGVYVSLCSVVLGVYASACYLGI